MIDDIYETLSLTEGTNTLTLTAIDLAGNSVQVAFDVFRRVPIGVAITSPSDGSLAAGATVVVTGTISDASATVDVNGVAAAVNGNTFSVTVPLEEGLNLHTATASDGAGGVGTATVSVLRDTTPPTVVISHPEDGAVIRGPTVAVTGIVNDRLRWHPPAGRPNRRSSVVLSSSRIRRSWVLSALTASSRGLP